MNEEIANRYSIMLPNSGKGLRELKKMKSRRPSQLLKAFDQLKKNPLDLKIKNIEKLNNSELGDYSIRVSKGDRLFYDVNQDKLEVYVLRVGPHDLYRLT